ncbi:MAG: hypothetical protein GXY86_11155 [Firmicutes bacterium]|nr:hypothetical protein [Bacillota bacterium]
MKRFYTIVLGIIFLFNLSFADNNFTKISNEIPGIWPVYQYQIGKNTYVEINLNLEMLFIATATWFSYV